MTCATRLLAALLGVIAAGWAQQAAAQAITTLQEPIVDAGSPVLDSSGNLFLTGSAPQSGAGGNGIIELSAASRYLTLSQTVSNFGGPAGVAIDGSGNIFFTDISYGTVKELPAAGGHTTVTTLATGFSQPRSLAIDASGNLFVADTGHGAIVELLAAGNYQTTKTLAASFGMPTDVALDGAGNLFVMDDGSYTVTEITAAGGYATASVVASNLISPMTVDSAGDIFAANGMNFVLGELTAAGGYQTVTTIANGLARADSLTADGAGNLFIDVFNGPNQNASFEMFSAASGYTVATPLAQPGPLVNTGITRIALDSDGNLVYSTTVGINEIAAAGGYTASEEIGAGFSSPLSLALATDGTAFVGDGFGLRHIPLSSPGAVGHTVAGATLTSGITAIAIDGSGNLFVADPDNNAVRELLASENYATVTTIGSGFNDPQGIALDQNGNVFVADTGNNAAKEILAAGGYATVNTLYAGFNQPTGIAVDGNGNVFVADTFDDQVSELAAASGNKVVTVLGSGFYQPSGVAVDGSGNIFVMDRGNFAVKEIIAAPPLTLAAVLPDSRAVALGQPATVFATMLNAGTTPLAGCQIGLLPDAPQGLSLSYQTTDPATNIPVGTPDTPVTIPGNDGMQTFELSFTGTAPFSVGTLPLNFGCAGAPPAAIFPGLNTLSLTMSTTPGADIIAVSATPTQDSIIHIPASGPAAFAIASINLGATDTISVTVDTGDAHLPLIAFICQTNSTTGACLSTPQTSLAVAFPSGMTETFSVFLLAPGPIALAPASSRIFVRFGDTLGATSVAVESP